MAAAFTGSALRFGKSCGISVIFNSSLNAKFPLEFCY
jgi:hypothetical protein